MTPKQNHLVISRLLQKADVVYYQGETPIMSDHEYDLKMRELIEIEAANPELRTPDSPSQRVGGSPTGDFQNVQHAAKMLSIDNCFNEDELGFFMENVRKSAGQVVPSFVLEPKFDGLSLTLIYRDGVLETAATRGNGEVGDDVTANARTIRSIPLRLQGRDVPALVEVRGEVYMPWETFNRLNGVRVKSGEEAWSNPRNTAVGALKQKDPKECAKRELAFVAYGMPTPDVESETDMLILLGQYGFVSARHKVVADPARLWTEIVEIDKQRDNWPFMTDGIVVKVNERVLQRRMGAHTKAPRWAAAMKIRSTLAETRVRAILLQVGKTGAIGMVAVVDPTDIDGTEITRCTVSNKSEVARKDIRVGDLVVLRKAGSVIPEIVEIRPESRGPDSIPFVMPRHCPSCHTELVPVLKADGTESAIMTCINTQDCPDQIRGRLLHYCSKLGMDVGDVGPALVNDLME